jgi:hypothetical protein
VANEDEDMPLQNLNQKLRELHSVALLTVSALRLGVGLRKV